MARCFADLELQVTYPVWLTRLRFVRSSGVKVNESRETKKDVQLPENIDDLELEVSTRTEEQDLGIAY